MGTKRLDKSDISELQDIISIQSISSDQKYADKCRAAAEWLQEYIASLDFKNVQIIETPGHPMVYGEISALGAHREMSSEHPTLLFYGHYDVQPAGELEEWDDEPFRLNQKDGNLVARGIADDKGQVMIFLQGLKKLLDQEKELAFNIKVLIEGEEEVGSLHVKDIIQKHKGILSADFAMVSDSAMLPDQPMIIRSMRGIVLARITIRNALKDLHSGQYGGAVVEPAMVLSRLFSSFVDQQGNILIPGFNKKVTELPHDELQNVRENMEDLADIEGITGAKAYLSDTNLSPQEKAAIAPSFTINGIHSGCQIDAPSTIIPHQVSSIFSFRIVADQDPDEIYELVVDYIDDYLPEGLNYELEKLGGYKPVLIDIDEQKLSTALVKADLAAEKIWLRPPSFSYEGGSIGIIGYFQEILGIETLMFGFDLPTGNIHGPNENMPIDQYLKGQQFIMEFLAQ